MEEGTGGWNGVGNRDRRLLAPAQSPGNSCSARERIKTPTKGGLIFLPPQGGNSLVVNSPNKLNTEQEHWRQKRLGTTPQQHKRMRSHMHGRGDAGSSAQARESREGQTVSAPLIYTLLSVPVVIVSHEDPSKYCLNTLMQLLS